MIQENFYNKKTEQHKKKILEFKEFLFRNLTRIRKDNDDFINNVSQDEIFFSEFKNFGKFFNI